MEIGSEEEEDEVVGLAGVEGRAIVQLRSVTVRNKDGLVSSGSLVSPKL